VSEKGREHRAHKAICPSNQRMKGAIHIRDWVVRIGKGEGEKEVATCYS